MFTEESRWDRTMPSEEREETPIVVGVIFGRGKVVPKWFLWRGDRVGVREVTGRWQDRRGADCRHYFSVTDGVNLYILFFSSVYLHWRMVRVNPLE